MSGGGREHLPRGDHSSPFLWLAERVPDGATAVAGEAWLVTASGDRSDWFRARGSHHVDVCERAKVWLERVAGKGVRCRPAPMVPDRLIP